MLKKGLVRVLQRGSRGARLGVEGSSAGGPSYRSGGSKGKWL